MEIGNNTSFQTIITSDIERGIPGSNSQTEHRKPAPPPFIKNFDARSMDELDRITGTTKVTRASSMRNSILSPTPSSVLSTPTTKMAPLNDQQSASFAFTAQRPASSSPKHAHHQQQQQLYETSFVGKEPKVNPTNVTTRLSAVPCYYRTLPDNKIQVCAIFIE